MTAVSDGTDHFVIKTFKIPKPLKGGLGFVNPMDIRDLMYARMFPQMSHSRRIFGENLDVDDPPVSLPGPLMVMEAGVPLKQALQANLVSPIDFAIEIIASSVMLTRSGVMHTDIKPGNALYFPKSKITPNGGSTLIDMGSLISMGQRAYFSTFEYMAPEAVLQFGDYWLNPGKYPRPGPYTPEMMVFSVCWLIIDCLNVGFAPHWRKMVKYYDASGAPNFVQTFRELRAIHFHVIPDSARVLVDTYKRRFPEHAAELEAGMEMGDPLPEGSVSELRLKYFMNMGELSAVQPLIAQSLTEVLFTLGMAFDPRKRRGFPFILEQLKRVKDVLGSGP